MQQPHILQEWKHLVEPEGWHPIANLYPLIPDDELLGMAENIEAVGLIMPIVLMEGKVLDGRNRLLACNLAGVEPTFTTWKGTDPLAWVLSQNSHRRQMTQSQKAAVAVKAIKLMFSDASMEGGDKRVKIADYVGVGRHYVSDALKIEQKDPGLLEQISTGSISIPSALRQLEWVESGGVQDEKEWGISKVMSTFVRQMPQSFLGAAFESAKAENDTLDIELMDYLWQRIQKEIYGTSTKSN